jgi:hypothetical protein
MKPSKLPLKHTLENLPPEWQEDLLPSIRQHFQASHAKLVILDDDPTGNQTVYNIPVLTGWSVEALRSELENDLPAFFILTNSRRPQAESIGQNQAPSEAARQAGRRQWGVTTLEWHLMSVHLRRPGD